jgi:hypothetical protein
LYNENPGNVNIKPHKVELKLLLPQQARRNKQKEYIWII